MPLFLGVDIGTYESKGVLMDASGEIVCSAKRAHTMQSLHPGYAEHDANADWWQEFREITGELLAFPGVVASEVAAVGISTIAPCCLPVDRDGNPLRNAILYGVDVRAAKQIEEITHELGADRILATCGSPLTSQGVGPKIRWIEENEPEIYQQTYKFVTGTTFLVEKLTGEYVIDHYTAAAFVPLYNVEKASWDEEIVPQFCRIDQLARCLWTDEIAGTVTAKAAAQTGLPQGIPVIVGTADAAAEAVSVGVANPGDMMLMYGSSIFMIHVVPDLVKDSHIWAGPYLFEGSYAVAAGMSTAGTLTRWLRDQVFRDLADSEEPYQQMMLEARDIPAGSDGLVMLPYFSGERTPINDPYAKGMIFGLNLTHTRAHIYKAALEGVGYGIAQHFDLFTSLGMKTGRVVAVGGGIKNPLWLQAVSDITQKEQWTGSSIYGAAHGDAMLAALGCGHYATRQQMMQAVRYGGQVAPQKTHAQRYRNMLSIYTRLYRQNKELMQEIGEIAGQDF